LGEQRLTFRRIASIVLAVILAAIIGGAVALSRVDLGSAADMQAAIADNACGGR
jgi:hypothetical protein